MAIVIDEYKYTDSYTSSDSTMQFYLKLKRKHASSALAPGTPNHFHKSTPLWPCRVGGITIPGTLAVLCWYTDRIEIAPWNGPDVEMFQYQEVKSG